MNAIVMNTLNGAVSEYTGFDFQSITPTKAGSTLGLYTLTGDLDVLAPIVAIVQTGDTRWDSSNRKRLDTVFVAVEGSGTSELSVVGPSTTYAYPLTVRANGVSRSTPGKGIRENYLAFRYSNADGADFRLDAIEVPLVPSSIRKAT